MEEGTWEWVGRKAREEPVQRPQRWKDGRTFSLGGGWGGNQRVHRGCMECSEAIRGFQAGGAVIQCLPPLPIIPAVLEAKEGQGDQLQMSQQELRGLPIFQRQMGE